MNFGQLDITEKENVFINKYVSYGNQELMITGFEMKESSTGKHLIKMLVESPTIKSEGFTADESAINGGQVGNLQVGIYGDYTNKEKAMEIGKVMQSIAKRAATKYGDDSLYTKVCAIDAPDMQSYLNQVATILKGKFVWFQVCAEAYGINVSEKTGKQYDKTFLKLGRFKYVGASEDELSTFDKNNKYHYGYSDKYHAEADAPVTASAEGTTTDVTDAWA